MLLEEKNPIYSLRVTNMETLRSTTPGSVSGSPLRSEMQISVVDVYEAASDIGTDLEHLAERYGRDAIAKLVPKVCAVLEQLEQYATRADKDTSRVAEQQLQAALEAVDLYRQERRHIRDKHNQQMEEAEREWHEESSRLNAAMEQLINENQELRARFRHNTEDDTPELIQITAESDVNELASSEQSHADREPKNGRNDQMALSFTHSLPVTSPSSDEATKTLPESRSNLVKYKEDLRSKDALLQEVQTELATIQGELERQKSTLRDQKQRHNILYKQARKLMEEKNELTNQLRQTTLAGIALEQQLHTAGIPVAVKVPITSLDTSLKPPFPPLAATTSSPLPQVKQEDAKQNPDDEGKPLENAERRPSGVADAEGDLPRFTLNELRRILNERNHLKAKVMELQDEIDITRRGRVADIPCTSVSSLSDQIHLADARIAFLSAPTMRSANEGQHMSEGSDQSTLMTSHSSSSLAFSTECEAEEEEAAVQGPINREPAEKLYGKRRTKKRESIIRNLYRGLFGETSIIREGIFYKLAESNAHLAD